MFIKKFFTLTMIVCAIVAASVTPSTAADIYSTSFEDFTLGAMNPNPTTTQNGWSGGNVPNFVNNNVGDEQIVNTQAHTGTQSWHYARGYGSPGSGTPFSPNLSNAVLNVGDTFSGSVWFKAHAAAGDGSSLAIESGNLAGNDRAEILAYVTNNIGGTGLTVQTFNWADGAPTYSTVDIATNLTTTDWHEVAFELTKTATGNALSLSVNGGAPVTVEAYLAEWRDSLSFPYAESSRLKFRDRGGDNPAHNGFYIDDVSYAFTAAIPEPTSLVLCGLSGVACLFARRRVA